MIKAKVTLLMPTFAHACLQGEAYCTASRKRAGIFTSELYDAPGHQVSLLTCTVASYISDWVPVQSMDPWVLMLVGHSCQ